MSNRQHTYIQAQATACPRCMACTLEYIVYSRSSIRLILSVLVVLVVSLN